ncbi:LacI family transcriptional regulator [Parasalinivibrio latis]|uniref:LacI family DNA-binding transcriptional regulator n=1 Tax=Parasalinivibrio latis TaxID=2952610 RepID=UPI0030E12E1E
MKAAQTKNELPTLDDVAKLAGVSKAVASRALSGKNRPVSKIKKQKVIEAANALGYVANPFAKSLTNQETGLIAVVVNHITDLSDLTLFDNLLQAIQSQGKQTLFVRLNSKEDIEGMRHNSFIHRVDAALVFSDLIEPEVATTLFLTQNIVMLNGKSSANGMSIVVDESMAIKTAVTRAKQLGLKQCFLVGGRQSSPNEAHRIKHYEHFAEDANIKVKGAVFCDYSYTKASEFFRSKSFYAFSDTAIFCTSDSMAMAALDFFKSNGADQLQHIFGFDNTIFSRTDSYRFSTIGYDKNKFIESILELISEDSSTDKRRIIEAEFFPVS